MIITQYTKTIYPSTLQGIKMADEMEQRLRSQGCFLSKAIDTQYVIIEAKYRFVIEEQEDGQTGSD